MKIVCVSASEVPSSKANSMQVMKACQALVQLGHDVRLLVPKFEIRNSQFDLQRFYGLDTIFPVEWLPSRPGWKRYDFCWTAIRRARTLGAQAVYVWPLQAAVFALLRRMPVLLELHGEPEGSLGPWWFRLFLRSPGRKRLLPITQALVDLLKRTYPRLGVPYCVSPNGVDLERYAGLPSSTAARQELGMSDVPTVVCTGHLYAGRGVELFVELARRFPHLNFLWVGGQPEDVEGWRKRLLSEGLSNLTLTGFVENSQLPRYQAAADVLLMPYERVIAGSGGGNSAAYCSPMKMFEYMACGRAIISSDLPVIREVLNDHNAVLCPPEDIAGWVQALRLLLDNPAVRETLARQAFEDVQGYTWIERQRKTMEGLGGSS